MVAHPPSLSRRPHREFSGSAFRVSWLTLLGSILIGGATATGSDRELAGFGAESNGLRCRLLAVETASDDEQPDPTKVTGEFDSARDIAFFVELKNVSEQPITLLGVRYGDSYPTAKGKLNTAFYAPHLFEFQFSDAQGQPIPRAQRSYESDSLVLSGVSAHEIDPGQSLRVLLRPALFTTPMQYDLTPGHFQVKVRYRGPSDDVIQRVKKHWPDKPQAKAWQGVVTSNSIQFAIAEDPSGREKPELNWGPATDGLQAAIEFQVPEYIQEEPTNLPGVPLKTPISVYFHVRNVSDKPITFASETSRQGDTIHVTDDANEEVKVSSPWYSGWPIDVRWILQPGDSAKLYVLSPVVSGIGQPGMYRVRYTIRFNSRQMKDEAGNVIFPKVEDYKSDLVTGDTLLFLRKRTPEDDERAKPPSFVGRVAFVDAQSGAPVESGVFTYRGQIKRKDREDRRLTPTVEIPECTATEATVSVRAPGYEETVFRDVKFKPDQTLSLKLKRALPARFRLVSSLDQSPVAGARIRYFNATSAKASSGPFPTKGIQGAIWTTSGDDGRVVLSSMQRVNPLYEKLGDSIYFFYVEPATSEFAPRFIGPIKAGQDLGDVTLGPLLEVSGEVHGTAEQLQRFAAEWDQPQEMTSENPDATWIYAVSKRLKTERVGNKLTFRLTGLRPGKIRFICNFGPRPHSVSHTYGRRDPKGTDVVFSHDLDKSFIGLVLTPEGQTPASDESKPTRKDSGQQEETEKTSREAIPVEPREALQKKISIKETDKNLFQLLSELEEQHGVPVTMSLKEMHAIGISATTKVSVHAKDVPLREVIDQALTSAGITFAVTNNGIEIPAASSQINIHYDIPGAEAETRIFVHQMGVGEIGSETLGNSKWTPLNNGKVLKLPNLKAGKYHVARMRLVDVAKAGQGRMSQGVYLDRREFELKEGQLKRINFVRVAGKRVSGRLLDWKATGLDRAMITVLSENATDENADTLDVTLFDGRSCDAEGEFETEPLVPGNYLLRVRAFEPLTPEQLTTTGRPQPRFTGEKAFTVPAKGEVPRIEVPLIDTKRL